MSASTPVHLDSFLKRLAEKTGYDPKPSSDGWIARCPVPGHGKGKGDRSPSLGIGVGKDGKILIKCFAGCPAEDVVSALGLDMKGLFPVKHGHASGRNGVSPRRRRGGLTLSALCKAKKLPREFLEARGVMEGHSVKSADKTKSAVIAELVSDEEREKLRVEGTTWAREVIFRYHSEDGALAARHRRRYALKGERKFAWAGTKEDGPIVPYGLSHLEEARKAEMLVLVEGETDVLTLWYHQFPALGIPGAMMVSKLKHAHIKGIRRIYVVKEPDQGGREFVLGVSDRPAGWKSWEGELHVVTLQ